jgi:hypothetical protein
MVFYFHVSFCNFPWKSNRIFINVSALHPGLQVSKLPQPWWTGSLRRKGLARELAELGLHMLGRSKLASSFHLLLLVSCLAYPSTLKTMCPSETLGFLKTMQHYSPEDNNVSNHCCENFRSKCNALWKYNEKS